MTAAMVLSYIMQGLNNVIQAVGETVSSDRRARAERERLARGAADADRARRRLELEGLALAALGVALFSFSLPATRLAVGGLDPYFVSFGRAAVAAILATILLVTTRAPLPTRSQLRSLAIVALGVVFVFPMFTSLALQHVDSSHGAVVIALLPAGTAVMAVLRAGEHPSRGFWLAAGAGLGIVVGFIALSGLGGLGAADVELLLATMVCALGYAEGGALARDMGGPRTICWALVLASPLTIAVAIGQAPTGPVDTDAWLGFAYVSAFSMVLGFFAWYAGLARGGVAKAGQVQLLQPVLTLALAAAVLGEHVSALTAVAAVAVLGSVAATQRARVERRVRVAT
jgi:drug/metabolite transporter (DMT)-like permease